MYPWYVLHDIQIIVHIYFLESKNELDMRKGDFTEGEWVHPTSYTCRQIVCDTETNISDLIPIKKFKNLMSTSS